MRSVDWLFVVSIALFISGIGFILAAGRTARVASQRPAGPPPATPVASVKQIMNGIVMPNATLVYNAVGTTISGDRVEEFAPKTDKEWSAVGDGAAALVESGNLLLLGARAVDTGDWVRMTREFMDRAKSVLVAAEARSVDGVFMSAGDLNATCDVCHEKYQR